MENVVMFFKVLAGTGGIMAFLKVISLIPSKLHDNVAIAMYQGGTTIHKIAQNVLIAMSELSLVLFLYSLYTMNFSLVLSSLTGLVSFIFLAGYSPINRDAYVFWNDNYYKVLKKIENNLVLELIEVNEKNPPAIKAKDAPQKRSQQLIEFLLGDNNVRTFILLPEDELNRIELKTAKKFKEARDSFEQNSAFPISPVNEKIETKNSNANQ
ncbi:MULTISPECIES: hypothetical protein [Lacticaseibacillus]|uniref:Uncharacterized protein n=2 Tax=Lacticaseibacillus TaxID=2759736 RepID=A0AAN1KFI6_LACCA|nr:MULTISPECIES: hypothetical protein [Lacticaseibacillus]ARY92904.1 hypothetical protein BGL52_14470 [Lacticaseibacillus casei]KAB1970069.1 hypothetical protein F9B82_06850 [Lacticaseibacillus casei]WLV80806.1 hypothetical protein LACSTY_002900 [Lacticaseibacillus sp. NCIMB 15473]WNX24767.1 hypothetical protein RWA15_14230 [Lacticaseibacillus casei]WNX27539.1 hypothetical protein RWA16_14230 [Lacticaseibacillus casei]